MIGLLGTMSYPWYCHAIRGCLLIYGRRGWPRNQSSRIPRISIELRAVAESILAERNAMKKTVRITNPTKYLDPAKGKLGLSVFQPWLKNSLPQSSGNNRHRRAFGLIGTFARRGSRSPGHGIRLSGADLK